MRNVAATFSEGSGEREAVRFARPYSVQVKDFPRTTVDYPAGFEGYVHPAIADAARADGVLSEEPATNSGPTKAASCRSMFACRLDAVSPNAEANTGKISFEG